MSLADITTTSGNTYVFVSSLPNQVIRADITNGTLQAPKVLTTAHTAGTSKKAARSLAKLTRTVNDSEGLPKQVSVHVVITRDMSSAITETIVSNMVEECADLLADTAFMASFIKGGHY